MAEDKIQKKLKRIFSGGFVNGEILLNSGSNVANVGNFDDNGPNVNDWNVDDINPNLGAARWIVSRRKILFWADLTWRILSIRQAFCLFPEVLFVILSIFCLLLPDCL